MAYVRILLDKLGVPSKIDVVSQITTSDTSGVYALLELTRYWRKHVPNYSTAAPRISGLLRDKRSASRRAKRVLVSGATGQDSALKLISKALMPTPILALPGWDRSFQLHTGASKRGAGAGFAEVIKGPWW